MRGEEGEQDMKVLLNERDGQRAGSRREAGGGGVMRQAGRQKSRRPVWTLNDAKWPEKKKSQ